MAPAIFWVWLQNPLKSSWIMDHDVFTCNNVYKVIPKRDRSLIVCIYQNTWQTSLCLLSLNTGIQEWSQVKIFSFNAWCPSNIIPGSLTVFATYTIVSTLLLIIAVKFVFHKVYLRRNHMSWVWRECYLVSDIWIMYRKFIIYKELSNNNVAMNFHHCMCSQGTSCWQKCFFKIDSKSSE